MGSPGQFIVGLGCGNLPFGLPVHLETLSFGIGDWLVGLFFFGLLNLVFPVMARPAPNSHQV